MPRVEIVVLIVELTPLPPKGEKGGDKLLWVCAVGTIIDFAIMIL